MASHVAHEIGFLAMAGGHGRMTSARPTVLDGMDDDGRPPSRGRSHHTGSRSPAALRLSRAIAPRT
jgi:hypothetical protein